MSEFRNCITTTTIPTAPAVVETCTNCQSNMKDNSSSEGCSPLTVAPSSIDTAVCVPILADELFDSINMQKDDIGSLTSITFTLDNTNTNYHPGQPVCIKKIGISYDFIGLLASATSNLQFTINGQTFTLDPTSRFNAGTVGTTVFNLINELNGTISIQAPCSCGSTLPGTKLRLIERGRAFQVSNLKIYASGLIGGTAFTATAPVVTTSTTAPTTLIPLSTLGISDMTFAGKICCPNKMTRMTINAAIETELTVDGIVPTSNYSDPLTAGNPGFFNANVDFSFSANNKIYASNKGAIAVFTTANAAILKNGEIIN